MENPNANKAQTTEVAAEIVEIAAVKTETKMATTKSTETINHSAENVVKSMGNMWREQYERVLDEQKKAMDRTFVEANRMASEGQHLLDLQMQAAKDMSHAWLENARRMTSMFQ